MIALTHIIQAQGSPNVLFIFSDNQSYYELSCHGFTPWLDDDDGNPITLSTPHIDSLASQGVDFQDFYAASYCSPSRSIALTGKQCIRTGVFNTLNGRSIMHKDHDTLAEIMKGHNYHTAAYGKWHLGYSYPHRPADRGFDETFVLNGGSLGQLEDYYGNTHHDGVYFHNGVQVQPTGFSTDVLFDAAMAWIGGLQDLNDGKPFFCYLSTPAVHGPYSGPDLNNPVSGDKAINPIIENLDDNVGEILAFLDTEGLADNTIVIFASDQGMFDRGAPHYDPADKETSQDARTQIPFMIRMPDHVGTTTQSHPNLPRGVDTHLAGLIDLAPTILDYCNIPIPADMDGISLRPLLTGDPATYPADRHIITQTPRTSEAKKWHSMSVKTSRWRLDGSSKLFDKLADPRCELNLLKLPEGHPLEVNEAEYLQAKADLTALYNAFWDSLPVSEAEQAATLSRNQIGATAFPDTSMTAMDWYTGSNIPYAKSHIDRTRDNGQSEKWAVRVMEPGTYTITLRQYPKEAPQELKIEKARVQLGDHVREWLVDDPTATSTSISITVDAGDYDLQVWMNGETEPEPDVFLIQDFGACYIDIVKESGPLDPSYLLTVENGTGDGVYTGGRIIDVAADPGPAGKHFYSWVSENGGAFADSANDVTTFTVPYAISSAMTISASYDYDSHDDDGDEIWDGWEIVHFGANTVVDGTVDSDNDGQLDYDEFVAGTMPTDNKSFFGVLESSRSLEDDVTIRFSSNDDLSKRRYRILYNENLTGLWQEVSMDPIMPSSGDSTEVTFAIPENLDRCFFKVEAYITE